MFPSKVSALRAIAPVEQSGPILFWFTAHSNLIAGVAELAWTDETKKNGGLRFTQLPYNACEQIRKWPYESSFRPSIGEDLTLHIPAPDYPSAHITYQRGASPALTPDAAPNLDSRGPESFEAILRESQLSMQGSAPAETQLRPWEIYLKQHGRTLSKAVCVLLLGMIIPTFYMHHRQAGKWLVWLGMKISGQVHTVAAAAITTSQAPQVDNTPAYESKPEGAPTLAIPQPASAATGETPKGNGSVPPPAKAQAADARIRKPAAGGTELLVQVAALAQEDDARKLAESLRQENFKAFVRTLPGDSLYRVTLGPYPDAASARTSVAKLKKAGFNAFIRRELVSESLGT